MAEAELEMSRSQESVDDQVIESPETKAPIEHYQETYLRPSSGQ